MRQALVVVMCALACACASPDADPSGKSRKPTNPRASTTPEATSPPPSTPAHTSPKPTAGRGTRIITADSEYGPMLFDASGQPIYLFTAESGDRPRCNGACAEDWPPVLTSGAPTASGAARAELLDTVRRPDGTQQLTYSGHRLYFYAHEGKYEVLCHNVVEYGGTWLVVQPDGSAAG